MNAPGEPVRLTAMSDADLTPAGSTQPIPGLPEDWHLKATEQIVGKVDMVREKTSGPAINVARLAVFGVMAAILGIVAALILVIGLVRAMNNGLQAWVFDGPSVWLAYLILGTIFLVAGFFLWSKRPKGFDRKTK